MRTINLKAHLPTIDAARRRLIAELRAARVSHTRTLKLIHGWGSTGRGGALAPAIRQSLARRHREGLVAAFIPGERFGDAHPATRALLSTRPHLRNDPDFNRGNPGITIVILKP